jgi:hypothetical protein
MLHDIQQRFSPPSWVKRWDILALRRSRAGANKPANNL